MADLTNVPKPEDKSVSSSDRHAGVGQFLEEEHLRGRIHGGIVMPDEPTFTQPKNGVQSGGAGERLEFETNPTSKRVKKGNDESVDAGYF